MAFLERLLGGVDLAKKSYRKWPKPIATGRFTATENSTAIKNSSSTMCLAIGRSSTNYSTIKSYATGYSIAH